MLVPGDVPVPGDIKDLVAVFGDLVRELREGFRVDSWRRNVEE